MGKEVATLTQTNILLRDYRLKVIGPDGKESLTEYGKRQRGVALGRFTPYLLGPGKEDVGYFNLGRLFDFSVDGKYKISVERMVDDPDWLHVTPASAKIEITVDESLLYAKPEKR